MSQLTNFSFKFRNLRFIRHILSILDEFEEELVEVSQNIDALVSWVHVVTDEHEVIINFKSSILTHNQANLGVLARFRVSPRDRAKLDERGRSHILVVDHDAELY